MEASVVVTTVRLPFSEGENVMKVKAKCLKCGFKIEQDIAVEMEANRFAEAVKFVHSAAQQHHHPEVRDSFQWRLGWEGMPSEIHF
jgi:hypothetical protein